MFKSLLSFILAFMIVSSVTANSRYTKEQLDAIKKLQFTKNILGDAVYGQKIGTVRTDNVVSKTIVNYQLADVPTSHQVLVDNSLINITYKPTGGQSIYDLQSNGSPVHIWQDPNDLDNIHAVFMTSMNTTFTPRISKYFFSSDRGVTWNFVADVPVTQNGFVAVTGTSDGAALITNHSADGGGTTRTQVFADAFAGLGSFTRLDPDLFTGNVALIWPRITATNSIMLANKFVFISSQNATSNWTTARNTGQSLSASTFSGYTAFPGDNAETYSINRGQDGRIGIAYCGNADEPGDVYFMESTDNGGTFSTAIKIYDANFTTGDSLGSLRGISLTYVGNSPKLVYEIVKQTTEGSFFPGFPSKIMYWSSNLPGADPNRSIVVADTNNTPFNPAISGGTTSDVLAPYCRPTIGTSTTENVMYVAFMAPSDVLGTQTDTNSFNDVYLTWALTSGTTPVFKDPIKINTTSPRRDWTYPSISNRNDIIGTKYYVNLSIQMDTVPGSFVNHTANPPSVAQQIFTRVEIDASKVGVNNISSEIPNNFMLAQNFPNPFNPSTSIRFALPKSSNVVLNIYDVSGKLVSTLINNQVVSAGLNEVQFNASSLPSGIYFYTLTADNFKDTKKMILVK